MLSMTSVCLSCGALVTGVLGLSVLQVISVCISGGAFSDQCMLECLCFKVTVYV